MKGLAAQLGGTRLSMRMKEANDRLKAGGTIDRNTVTDLLAEYQLVQDGLGEWLARDSVK